MSFIPHRALHGKHAHLRCAACDFGDGLVHLGHFYCISHISLIAIHYWLAVCDSGSVGDWADAIKKRNAGSLTSELMRGPKEDASKASRDHGHFIFVLHRAVDTADRLINGEFTRDEAQKRINYTYEVMNGTVQIFQIHGNLTSGEKWMNERSAVTEVDADARRWWDMAADEFSKPIKTIVKLNEAWQALITQLPVLKDEDIDGQKKLAYDFKIASDEYSASTFLFGVPLMFHSFVISWTKK